MDALHRLAPGSAHWPRELDELALPPDQLWLGGDLALLGQRPRIAIVGSRSPSPYGEAQARRFATHFAEAGATVVSGLARGVDSSAHTGALDAGGRSLAVLGNGVDRPWPSGPLTERMQREGALLSEYSPGTRPRRHHFPLRNRLIAGLSLGVLVVEAAQKSGSLITARWALDQGRTVFALPGRVDHPMARGCHLLLRDGATLVESPEEVLAELGLRHGSALETELPPSPLVEALRGETRTAEELATYLRRSLAEVWVELIQAELTGEVVRAPGGLWRLAVHGG